MSDSSSSPRLPDFLGIGVQKGGTTTLHRLLAEHPGVVLSRQKELHYFTLHFSRGVHWYASHFDAATAGQRCGEITPYYLFHPEAAERIHSLVPQARLLVLLRDPVERTLSQYFHSRRLGLEPLDLEAALDCEPARLADAGKLLMAAGGRHRSHQEHSYVARSRYERQLPAYTARFKPNQLLVLRSEDLFFTTGTVWQQVLRFLNLAPMPLPHLSQPANAGGGEAAGVARTLRQRLRQELEPTYAWAQQTYGIRWEGAASPQGPGGPVW